MLPSAKDQTDAFDDLYKHYKHKIFNYFYRMTGNRENAEDLTQETFLKAYQGIDRFEGRSSISTWLFRIAVNTYLNAVAKTKQAPEECTVETIKDPSSLTKEMELRELQWCMQKFLSDLPDSYRTPIILYELQGLRIKEIAEIMNISPETVKIRLIRGRKKLRAIMCKQCSFFRPNNPCNCRGEKWKAK